MKKSIFLLLVGIILTSSGCKDYSDNQDKQSEITEAYSSKLSKAQPYPLQDMNDSSERANLSERLLRLNNPNKIGYVYELTQNGQIIAVYSIKGKVSSMASQLTNTQTVTCPYSTASCQTVETMGDDGSYGPEEQGIFFFTTTGVLVEYNGLWQYSDAPLNMTSKPLLIVDGNAKPSSSNYKNRL